MELPAAPKFQKYLEERGALDIALPKVLDERRPNGNLIIYRVKLNGESLGCYQIYAKGDDILVQEFWFWEQLPGYTKWNNDSRLVERYNRRLRDTIEGMKPIWPVGLVFYNQSIDGLVGRLDLHTSIPFP